MLWSAGVDLVETISPFNDRTTTVAHTMRRSETISPFNDSTTTVAHTMRRSETISPFNVSTTTVAHTMRRSEKKNTDILLNGSPS